MKILKLSPSAFELDHYVTELDYRFPVTESEEERKWIARWKSFGKPEVIIEEARVKKILGRNILLRARGEGGEERKKRRAQGSRGKTRKSGFGRLSRRLSRKISIFDSDGTIRGRLSDGRRISRVRIPSAGRSYRRANATCTAIILCARTPSVFRFSLPRWSCIK